MTEILLISIICICIPAIAFLIYKFVKQNSELSEYKIENARLEEKIEFYEVQKDKIEKENELRFKNLANEILRNNSLQLKAQQEGNLEQILKPLRENILNFQQVITQNFISESTDRKTLAARIEELKQLQQSIGKEAKELTTALRGNTKVQGDWGEMILESILERSGLEKGVHYTVQEQIKDENIRPDVVMYYPDGRAVVIDSKVSLTAFVKLVNT